MADKVLDNLLLSQLWQKSVNTFLVRANYLQTIYPIGSIYMSVNSTSPASLFGGTWEQLQDNFLVGAGNRYSGGASGGSLNHSHSLESGYALAVHFNNDRWAYKTKTVPSWQSQYFFDTGSESSGAYNLTGATKLGGTTDSESSLPPYLAVYMWKRVS